MSSLIKIFFYIIILVATPLVAKEKYTFFGITLNEQLPNTINLTGETDLGRPLFKPKEKNERFEKYFVTLFPISKKVLGIYAGSNFDSMIFPNLNECIKSRNFYADYFKQKYQIKNIKEQENNLFNAIILTKEDGLNIIIECPGKGQWMGMNFQDTTLYDEFNEEIKQIENKTLKEENDTTGL